MACSMAADEDAEGVYGLSGIVWLVVGSKMAQAKRALSTCHLSHSPHVLWRSLTLLPFELSLSACLQVEFLGACYPKWYGVLYYQ